MLLLYCSISFISVRDNYGTVVVLVMRDKKSYETDIFCSLSFTLYRDHTCHAMNNVMDSAQIILKESEKTIIWLLAPDPSSSLSLP